MANKILWTYIVFLTLFSLSAGLHLFIPLYTRHSIAQAQNLETVAINLLLNNCPLTASMINSFIMFTAVVLAVPAIFLPQPKFRFFLVAHTYLVVGSALFTLAIGLNIWFSTLESHKNFAPVWNASSEFLQSMLQYKFQCCGYNDASLFIKDTTCTSAAVAAQLGGCMTPFCTFANKFLDIVFTSFFGFVAVDMLLLMNIFCLMKDRRERHRYKLIDEKRGWGPI